MKNKTSVLYIILPAIFLFTSQIFSQWTLCTINPITGLGSPSISVASPNVVWISGGSSNSPKVMRSTDGGATFTNVTGNMTSIPELYCIWAVDATIAYVGDGGAAGGAGGNAKVWKTTNGGTNWSVILTTGGTSGFINGIVFSRSNPQIGFIESDPPTGTGSSYWIQKTTNGGATWSMSNPPGIAGMASTMNTLVMIDDLFYLYGIGSTPPPRIRFTTNGGINWNVSNVSVMPGIAISSVAVKSDKSVWICGTGQLPNIGRTTDGGATWSMINTGNGLLGHSSMKWVYGTTICYLTGSSGVNGCARKSTDDGLTWVTQTTAGLQDLTSMDLVYTGGTIYAYAVSVSGEVVKLIETPSGIDPNNTGIPASYALEQNYPNPFNPSTTVRFSIPNAGEVSLKVYDITGTEVMSLVNGYKAAGNYVETIDASGLASGVYIYTLRAGDFVETKKMSLVK